MADAAYLARLQRYRVLCEDVLATLGNEHGMAWLRERFPVVRKSLATVERDWAYTKSQIRKAREEG